jgi:hypothetical protein
MHPELAPVAWRLRVVYRDRPATALNLEVPIRVDP